MKKTTKALYGSVAVLRTTCPRCEENSFLDSNGKTLCCDALVSRPEITSIERRSDSIRKTISGKLRQEILEQQDNECFYCRRPFGLLAYNTIKLKYRRLTAHIDHVYPFLLGGTYERPNLVAACSVCNLLKRAKVRCTMSELRTLLAIKWRERGWTTDDYVSVAG